jgi:hypothetical protein
VVLVLVLVVAAAAAVVGAAAGSVVGGSGSAERVCMRARAFSRPRTEECDGCDRETGAVAAPESTYHLYT